MENYIITSTDRKCSMYWGWLKTLIYLNWILIIFLFYVSFCFPCLGEELLPGDIIDAYQYNQSQFLGSRVLYGFSEKLHTEFFGKSHETDDEYSTKKQGCIDYWTDSTNFLIRQIDTDSTNFDKVTFTPKSDFLHLNNVTASDLETTYRYLQVSSYVAKDNLTRIWRGFYSQEDESSKQTGRAYLNSSNLLITTPILSPPYLFYGYSDSEHENIFRIVNFSTSTTPILSPPYLYHHTSFGVP